MKDILAALEGIAPPGAFCTKQTAPAEDLRIRIQGSPRGSGELKWPLSGRAVKALIKVAQPARFGWKDQTLLDRGVRDAWEIPKSRVKIDNRTWNRTLNPLLEEFRKRLGLPGDGRLKAHLHNLLVYEPGQFFRPHQDSEKLDGMVATLVVVLPSSYRGGTLRTTPQPRLPRHGRIA